MNAGNMKTGRAWFCAALMASALFIPGLPLFGQSGDDPAAVAALGTARRMIAAGRYEEARKILDDAAKSPSAAVSSEARKQLSNLSLGEEWLMKLAGVLNATVESAKSDECDGSALRTAAEACLRAADVNSVLRKLPTVRELCAKAACSAGDLTRLQFLRLCMSYGEPVDEKVFSVNPARILEIEKLILNFLAAEDDDKRASVVRGLKELGDVPADFAEAVVKGSVCAREACESGTFKREYTVAMDNSAATMHVFVPRGYTPGRRWPLLVTLHGTGGEGGAFLQWWMRQGQDQGWLLCSPTATINREKGWGGTDVERSCILSAIDDDRVFLTGYSMGGHGTWDMGVEFPHVFAGIIPMAGKAWGISKDRLHNIQDLPVYVWWGLKDMHGPFGGIAGMNRTAVKMLKDMKADVLAVENPEAGHGDLAGRITRGDFLGIFDWMDARTRKKHPRKFKITMADVGKDLGRELGVPRVCHWLEPLGIKVEKFRTAGSVTMELPPFPMLKAEVKSGNVIHVETRHVTGYRVLLSPRFVDMARKVKIISDDKVVFFEMKPPDVGFMLDHALRTGDGSLLYWNCVEVKCQE
jgi:predicted esterase